jgi:hypothetical protein
VQSTSDEEDVSDIDSDFGLHHHAIQHVIGDIAEDVLGTNGSLLMDFKPTPPDIKRRVQVGRTK